MRLHQSHSSSLLGTFALLSLLDIAAAAKPPFNTTQSVNAECKSCPYQQCTNVVVYDPFGTNPTFDGNITLTCWTRGEEIGGADGDNIWIRTTDECYVTQYVLDYDGPAEDDLDYCGKDSEEEFYTSDDATTAYDTECNINPWITDDTIKYYAPDVDLTITCWTDGDTIIDDSIWVKTTDNCYAAEKGLQDTIDKDILDNCGPLTFLEVNDTGTETNPSDPDTRRRSRNSKRAPVPIPEGLHANYLINVTVGEDYAYCHELPTGPSDIIKRYPFGKEIFLQCISDDLNATNPDNTYWELTTDFCYVRSIDLFQSPEGDYYKFPRCSNFGQPK